MNYLFIVIFSWILFLFGHILQLIHWKYFYNHVIISLNISILYTILHRKYQFKLINSLTVVYLLSLMIVMKEKNYNYNIVYDLIVYYIYTLFCYKIKLYYNKNAFIDSYLVANSFYFAREIKDYQYNSYLDVNGFVYPFLSLSFLLYCHK
jgi:hypothetical protein